MYDITIYKYIIKDGCKIAWPFLKLRQQTLYQCKHLVIDAKVELGIWYACSIIKRPI